MSRVLVTDEIACQPAHGEPLNSSLASSKILPGWCDAEALRRMIGDASFDAGIAAGVIVPVMD